MYVLVIENGYDTPEVVGPFESKEEAEQAALDLVEHTDGSARVVEVQSVGDWLRT